jgi:hypothetical protein
MKVDVQDYMKLVDRFVALANELKDEGTDPNTIANALMESSGIYATFVSAGNDGYLEPSGVDKMTDAFRQILTRVQDKKKARIQAQRST